MFRTLLLPALALVVLTQALPARAAEMPANQGATLEVNDALLGVLAKYSYVWVVSSDNGVVLIDTGPDKKAPAVVKHLKDRGQSADDVVAIVLTHGHGDHVGGIEAFPKARLYSGVGDADRIAKKTKRKATEVKDGETVVIDGLEFTAIALPGHTPGSTGFQMGNLVFSGDTVFFGKKGAQVAPDKYTTDKALALESMKKLAGLDFVKTADGHVGYNANAKDLLTVWAEAQGNEFRRSTVPSKPAANTSSGPAPQRP